MLLVIASHLNQVLTSDIMEELPSRIFIIGVSLYLESISYWRPAHTIRVQFAAVPKEARQKYTHP